MTENQIENWLEDNENIEFVTVATTDLNGILRGKRLPRKIAPKVAAGGLKMPLA